MLEHITQSSKSIHARAIPPSEKGSLRTEKQNDSAQIAKSAAKREQAERLDERRIEIRREERREASRYRADHETASYSSKNSTSQASQIADKLLEAVRQSRQEQVKIERHKTASESNRQQMRLDRTYQAASPVKQPDFVDEMA